MTRQGGFYLDKSPTSTVGICRVCGARCQALTTTGARTLIAAHVAVNHRAVH
jgi:hypothetical protein